MYSISINDKVSLWQSAICVFLERIIICSWRCHLRAGLATRLSRWRWHLTRSLVATRTIITGITRLVLPFETWLLQALFFIKPGMHPTRVVLRRKGQLCPAKLKAPWWGLLQVMMMTDPKLESLYMYHTNTCWNSTKLTFVKTPLTRIRVQNFGIVSKFIPLDWKARQNKWFWFCSNCTSIVWCTGLVWKTLRQKLRANLFEVDKSRTSVTFCRICAQLF